MKRKFVGLLNKLRTTAWTRIAKKDVDKPNLMMGQQIVLADRIAKLDLNKINITNSLTDLTASMPDWNTHDTATLSITPTKVKITKHSYPRKKRGYPQIVTASRRKHKTSMGRGSDFHRVGGWASPKTVEVADVISTTRKRRRKPSKPIKPKRNVSRSKRFDVLNRDKFRCTYCGLTAKETELHVDHIKAVSKGGSSEMDNLITACIDCNLGKHAKDINPKDLAS